MQQIIFHQQKHLRIAGSQDAPLICAKDACEMLGIVNSRDALNRVPEDEKGVVITDTLGGPQPLVFVNEPGFYRLVFLSRKPQAEEFKTKVFRDVLPAIRKTGYYRAARTDLPPEIAALPAGRKDELLERLGICEEIGSSRRVLACAKEIEQRHSGRRGFKWRTLLKWYYRWKNSGFSTSALLSYQGSYKPPFIAAPRLP